VKKQERERDFMPPVEAKAEQEKKRNRALLNGEDGRKKKEEAEVFSPSVSAVEFCNSLARCSGSIDK